MSDDEVLGFEARANNSDGDVKDIILCARGMTAHFV